MSTMRAAVRFGLFCVAVVGLCVTVSQMTCAEVEMQQWPDDGRRDGGTGSDGDGAWHCYTGSPSTEEQFLNRCTNAERIERPSNIPPMTWDGRSPLP